MNSLSLIVPVLLVSCGFFAVIRALVWLVDLLWTVKEQPGLYPPLRITLYVLVILGMVIMLVIGGGLIALLRSIIPW